MRRKVFLLFSLAALAAVTTTKAQVSKASICDGIPAQIRGSSAVLSGRVDPWSKLSKGDHPLIEMADQSEMHFVGFGNSIDKAQFVKEFVTKFNASEALQKAFAELLEAGNVEVLSLAGSDIHIAESTGGTAHCESFMFFQTARGRQSQLLPDLPAKGDHDGDNLICSSYGGNGYLARVGGVESFLETYSGDNKYSMRVVPMRDGRWTNACAVEVVFNTKYNVSNAFAPGNGPLTERDLKTLAPQIVATRELVTDAQSFVFGPALSDDQKSDAQTMVALASKMRREPFPAFGSEKSLEAGADSMASGDSFPMVIKGQVYLLRLGEGQLGCCTFPGPLLIFYRLKDGQLDSVGSAIVEKVRGTLQSVRAIQSR
jgi:hypothetical protein